MEDAEPEPVVDLFTRMLPHELRVEVLRLLVRIHVQEHEEVRRSGQWSFGMATRTGKHAKGSTSGAPARWVGFESGMRELVKLGRVSRSWQALSLDGQLWAVTSFSPFPHIPIPLLVRITKSAGPFMKTLNLRGVSGITADVLMDITENVRAKTATRYDGEEGCNTYSRASIAQDSRRLHKSSKSRRSHFGSLAIPSTLRATETQLTCINLQGCSSITTKSLHSLLVSSPVVEKLILRGLSAVTNTTCEILGDYFDMSARGRGSAFVPSRLVHLDLGRCSTMDATGIERMIGFVDVNFHPVGIWSRLDQRHQIPLRRFPQLKVLKLGGLKKVTGQTMHSISWGIPSLEVLDLRGSTSITDEDLGELGKWDERYEDIAILASQTRCARVVDLFQDSGVQIFEKVTLTSREMGFNPLSHEKYFKRVTRLKHLCFSSCSRLTDNALSNLAYSVPYLQNLEMGGIGAAVRDTGLVRLIGTTPMIRRVDLEEASEITDTLLDALTPPAPPTIGRSRSTGQPSSHAGQHLEHLVLSYVGNVTDNALLALINGCTKLTCLEVDNTRVSDNVLKEFIRICRQRERKSAEILAVDCRNVTRAVLEGPVSPSVRYRKGWRGWDARSLGYYDERDRGDIMSGIDAIPETTRVGDECNEDLVVMKSFHTWQAVDTMTAARERRRKLIMSRRSGDGTGVGVSTSSPRRDGNLTPRWLNWRSTSVHQAQVAGGFDLEDVDERGCVIM
ncbi:hypothetical protein FRC03_009462 [Tulasnella sp. 419]|nr:hypothetical protein FRC03_009462 [Tulasnella sp. 419]